MSNAEVSREESLHPISPEEGMNEIFRILNNEESLSEKTEAMRSGKLSDRLLKRISLGDMRELIAKGANPCIADDVGQTALMHAAYPPFDVEKFRLLVRAGADLEARRNDGYTGLQLACAGGEARAVKEWILAGADVNATSTEGVTPLMLGATWCEIVLSLLTAGANVHAADHEGHTALTYAILKQSWHQPERQLNAMRAMIDAGADLTSADRAGITPLGHARRMLAKVQLEEEVTLAFGPVAESPFSLFSNMQKLAKDVVVLLESYL